jgi:CubicO group peptidase (beta-lactamase class C family)
LALVPAGCGHQSFQGDPEVVSPAKFEWSRVTRFLDSAVTAGAAPGAVLGVIVKEQRFIYGTGRLGQDDSNAVGGHTLYDLASVTKVVGLTTAIMLAVDEGKLSLDAPIQQYVPEVRGPDKNRITLRFLLAHASGLPVWKPLFHEVHSRGEMYAVVDSISLDTIPGTVDHYSDLGAILLTQAVESVYHERIDSLLERRLFVPLGMMSTRFVPPDAWRGRIAPTELDPWRGRVLQGEVHDENAAVMDGVSGHAGLFSSVEDLLTFSEWLLEQWDGQANGRSDGQADRRADGQAGGRSGGQTNDPDTPCTSPSGYPSTRPPVRPSIRPFLLREFTRPQHIAPGSSRALGWDTPSAGSSAGTKLSPLSFGHTGFTGTSLWIDPEHQVAIVLLSNRINPTRANTRWNPVRAQIADLVMTTLFEDVR